MRMEMAQGRDWVDRKKGSGKLANPSKLFVLRSVANFIRDFNAMGDKDGLLYSIKSMIRRRIERNLNRMREVQQLFPHLQAIVRKYQENFNGESVADNMAIEEAVTVSYGD